MSKKKKEFSIGIIHVDIVSFMGLIVGVFSIANAILEKTLLSMIFLILGIPLTILSAINLIVSIHVLIVYSIIQNKEIPKESHTKGITKEDAAFKYTVLLLILTIVVFIGIIL